MKNEKNQKVINILIVEDQQIISEGLTLILSRVEGFGKITSCLDIYSLLETITIEKPEVILLDFSMPMVDGIQCLKTIVTKFPQQKVIMLTGYDDTELIREALKQGAKGYVLKNIAKQELITAIKEVHNGQNYLDGNVQKKVLEDFLNKDDLTPQNNKPKVENYNFNLSNREKEVLALISEGKSSSKIAALLFISVNTVDTHRKNIMAKCGVKKITELITYANKNNLI